jgi:hypothetical protein
MADPVLPAAPTRSMVIRKLTFLETARITLWQILIRAGWREEELPGYRKKKIAAKRTLAPMSAPKLEPTNPKSTLFQTAGLFLHVTGEIGGVFVVLITYMFLPFGLFIGARIFQLKNTAQKIAAFARKKAAVLGYLVTGVVFKEATVPRSWMKRTQPPQTENDGGNFKYLEDLNILRFFR